MVLSSIGVTTKYLSDFEEIKLLITKAPILAYYDPQKKLVLQCNASNKGLGATLLKDGKPLAYKSRSLTVIWTTNLDFPKL